MVARRPHGSGFADALEEDAPRKGSPRRHRQAGMTTMAADGVRRAAAGETTSKKCDGSSVRPPAPDADL